jgi:DNA repair protein RecN (Recombination protein N)
VLSELTIENLAIIDRLRLHFAPGFNVLTGETGAGKSIIVDAVSLLLGGRGEAELIRSEANQAVLEGIFALDGEAQAAVNPLLEQEGLEGDDPGTLILAREIRREGRNVCRVNGRAVPLRLLEQIGQQMVDIHGQTEHLSLMRVREHVDLLDRYGDLWPLREQVATSVRQLRAVRRELAGLRQDERELARRIDLLRYQVQEIEAAALCPGEVEQLELERNRLANAEQLRGWADQAYAALYEGSEEQGAVVDLLQEAARALAGLARLDPSTDSLRDTAESVGYQLEDLVETIRQYRARIEFNPRRLTQTEDRLALIHSLQRKYGDSIEQVLDFAKRARNELQSMEHSEERIAELEGEEEGLLRQVGQLGAELSERRRKAGQQMAVAIEKELEQLNMARARFGVDIAWQEHNDGVYVGEKRVGFDLTGLDRVEFLVAPNIGEPLKPLVRIASGGETSRLMLALKTVLAQADRTPTLIFDEIDAGIGGRVGAVIGHKLWGLTTGDGVTRRRHQVLCVTHLPQLASHGDLHLRVRKGVVGQRTVTEAVPVAGEEREIEIAGMLGSVTEGTRASAREMLLTSEQTKSLEGYDSLPWSQDQCEPEQEGG